MIPDTVEYFRQMAEHGPPHPVVSSEIRGLWTPAGWYLCSHCAGRITQRGCGLPQGVTFVNRNKPEPYGVCCVCNDDCRDSAAFNETADRRWLSSFDHAPGEGD